jgi:hypothetical protein
VAFGMVMPGGLAVGLEASAYFTPSQAGYSSSAHVCILDVDLDLLRACPFAMHLR